MFRQLFVFALLVVAASSAMAQMAPPSTVRAVVLDTSGSMNGERINTAKAEILSLAKQLPPSKDNPIVIIPFHEVPHSVGTFTDLPTFETHLAKLTAAGDTSIASGLDQAVKELRKFRKTSNVCLLLYTDGEDDDATGIGAAEKKLDALFADRSRQNLQSLLFCKRWENANAKLLANLTKSGNVKIIDAGQLKVVPVTLTPTVKVLRATWAKTKPLSLELRCQAQIALSGMPFDPSFPTATLKCTAPGATLKPTILCPGDPKPTLFTVQLSLPTEVVAAGKTVVPFTIAGTGQPAIKNGVVLPQLAASRLDIPVDLPPLAFDVKFSATLKTAKAPTWSDPLRGKPVQHLTLTCIVLSEPDIPWPQPLNFRIKPDGCRLLSAKDTLPFQGPGTLSLPVSLEADNPPAGSTFSVALLVQADLPAGFSVKPPDLRLTNHCPLPMTVDTKIAAKVQSISETVWTDLVQGLATFYADVTFDVKGPIPPNTQLTLVCPPTIRKIDVKPTTLSSGTQTLRLTIQARFPAAFKATQFEITTQPPAPAGAVRFLSPSPLKLKAIAPPPVQLALSGGSAGNPEVTVTDPSAPIVITGTPVLLSHDAAINPTGVTAIIRTGPLLGSQTSAPAPLNAPLALPLTLAARSTSFFFDATIEEDIDIVPSQSSPALVGSRQRCTVTVEAPFKRVFFYGAAALALIVVAFLVVRSLLPNGSANDSTDNSKTPGENGVLNKWTSY
jgi:uncharacterized protein YegL